MTGDVISLFSGVGMADYALERAGWNTIVTAEVDPWCQGILRARFPHAVHKSDVRDVRYADETLPGGTEMFERPLMVVGGFPCQDVAGPGTGLGINGARSGLVREQLRIIEEFQPEYALFENAPQLTGRGLAFIVGALTRMDYYVRWECIPAGLVGAPHLRDRCWIMARKQPWRRIHDRLPHLIGDANRLPAKLPRAGYAVPNFYHVGRVFEFKPMFTVREARIRAQSIHGGEGVLPTPTKSDGSGGPGTSPKRTGGKNLRTVVAERWGNGRLNPAFVEWMMGVPQGWTDPNVRDRWGVFGPPVGFTSVDRFDISPTAGYNVPNRAKRIQALGNGLVPDVATLAIRILLAE